MPRRASWRELRVGLIALAATTALGLVVLIFARVGTLHGSTFRLYAMTGEARGIIRSSEVWLEGQKVGVVKDVTFLPPSNDVARRVLIMMDVLSSARQGIRRNSTAQVRSGGTLIGAPVVYLTIGTTSAPGVGPGDTIRAIPQSDLETMTSEFAIASRQFPEIISNIKLLNQQLHGVDGTIGAFGVERGGVELVRADSIRTLLSSGSGSYGRLRRDSTLLREVAAVRNELDIVRARMASPTGTLGRVRSDSALMHAVTSTQREMALIFADIHRRPLRYVRF
jgi:MlaD protein